MYRSPELLAEKFSLFSGVFGASDEVLGTIESGVDFENRILAIYHECRTPEEIESAFHKLQEEMDERSIRFQYRPATLDDWSDGAQEGKTKPPAQKELIELAAKRVLAVAEPSLAAWITELGRRAPSESEPDRTVLQKHIKNYSDVNTFDYFIHKDLGGFLRRELDFYIKNEVMHLDDVQERDSTTRRTISFED